MKKIVFIISFLLITIGYSQISKPSASPFSSSKNTVGLTEISLEYSRPQVNSRTIFGSLIPYGKLWRTGANLATKISFSTDIILGGNTIPKGDYSLYTIPNKKEWTIIIHKNTKLWGSGNYNATNDLVRFKVPVQYTKVLTESLTIDIENYKNDQADLSIAWEYSKVVIPIVANADTLIKKEIDQKIFQAKKEDIKAQTYFDAGMYYYSKEYNLSQALNWIDQAVIKQPNAFWFVYYQAELSYTLNKTEKAKKAVIKALEMAKKSPSGDYGYIAKCELLLKKINA